MMVSPPGECAIFDDWLLRRQRLAASENIPEPYRRVQLQVLDYLIRRYGASAAATNPARFPATAAFYSNDRLIVVHHHLGRGKIAGVKNKAEAVRRVGDVLSHLRRVHEEQDDTVEAHNDFAAWVDELEQQPEPPSAWQDIWRQLRHGSRAAANSYKAIAAALDESPYLPRPVLAFLCCGVSHAVYDTTGADLLLRCRSEAVPELVARAWRERVNDGQPDVVTAKLRDYLVHEPRALDHIREHLADQNPAVQLAAIELMREGGTLDDVALLSDLVSLPHAADEHPDERRALLYAMWGIAHRD